MASRIEQIRRRESRAIRGPWRWFGNVATHQIYLGTDHSGRIILLTPHAVKEEFVWDHDAERSYTLEEARKRVIELCGAHLEGSDPGTREADCRCDEIRVLLGGELEPEEGARHMMDRDYRHTKLSRHMRIETGLRFQGRGSDGAPDILLHDYRDDDVARYEVLDGRTMSEHLGHGGRRSDLYREDIVGLATPEAEFIAHAREDVAYLLKHIEELGERTVTEERVRAGARALATVPADHKDVDLLRSRAVLEAAAKERT